MAGSSALMGTAKTVDYSISQNLWVIGGSVTNTAVFLYSTDGTNWTANLGTNSIFTTPCASLKFSEAQSLWVAVGGYIATTPTYLIAWSTDGKIWTGVTGSNTYFNFLDAQCSPAISYSTAFNQWVIVASQSATYPNETAFSSDGKNWTLGGVYQPIFGSRGYAILCKETSPALWVAGGQGTFYPKIGWSSSAITSATSFTLGTPSTALFNNRILGLGYSPTLNMFVACGFGAYYSIAYSTDGKNWTGVTGSITNFTTAYCAASNN